MLAARTKEGTAALAAATSPGQAGPATAPGQARPLPRELPADMAALTSDNPGCATLTLLNPSGGVVDTSGQVCDVTSTGIGPHSLHVSGTYTVRLELDQTATGRGSLKVST